MMPFGRPARPGHTPSSPGATLAVTLLARHTPDSGLCGPWRAQPMAADNDSPAIPP